MTRREVLEASLLAGLLGPSLLAGRLAAGGVAAGIAPGGEARRIGLVPFVGEGSEPLETLLGDGLGGRRALDLSTLTPEALIVPSERFFVRTRYPDGRGAPSPWRVVVGGHVRRERVFSLEELRARSRPMGVHLIECSGNGPRRRFGLIGAAEWSGVPASSLLDSVNTRRAASRVRVSGFDHHSRPAPGSVPRASWIFTGDDLERAGAFFATAMNGLPLPLDNGHPVRLVVPGWYGCASIKWVTDIAWVEESVPATAQMKEFASRTHQEGIPERARDYRPAEVDTAAMPIRVEKWWTRRGAAYRVVGIVWGGKRPVRSLRIRFDPGTGPESVEHSPAGAASTWSLWSYWWKPPAPGRYR
ncbi:MAG: molybdopterin-dependent oxidoreductase, partial [Candidatus Binatia bacterium]